MVVLFLDEYLNVVEIGTTHNAENVNFLTCFVVRRGRKEKAIMKKKCRIEVTYQNDRGIDPDIDNKIRLAMETVGAEWYAQGFNQVTKTRDICFNLEIEG